LLRLYVCAFALHYTFWCLTHTLHHFVCMDTHCCCAALRTRGPPRFHLTASQFVPLPRTGFWVPGFLPFPLACVRVPRAFGLRLPFAFSALYTTSFCAGFSVAARLPLRYVYVPVCAFGLRLLLRRRSHGYSPRYPRLITRFERLLRCRYWMRSTHSPTHTLHLRTFVNYITFSCYCLWTFVVINLFTFPPL